MSRDVHTAQLYSLADPRISSWVSYTRAPLVSKDRRHLFVTPCFQATIEQFPPNIGQPSQILIEDSVRSSIGCGVAQWLLRRVAILQPQGRFPRPSRTILQSACPEAGDYPAGGYQAEDE
jgi:hypothetical protein